MARKHCTDAVAVYNSFMKWRFILITLAVFTGGTVLLGSLAQPYLRSATSYKAKAVCSEYFVAGRVWNDILANDFIGIHPIVSRATVSVDQRRRVVKARVFGIMGTVEAVYRPGFGCALAIDGQPDGQALDRLRVKSIRWPVEVNAVIQDAVEELQSDERRETPADIRALLIIQDGVIIAESYAEGFDANVPMQSWSMAKSVTQAMAAIAIDQGLISLEDRELMPDWTGSDPRADITVENLLHMTDGLNFVEDYDDPTSDVTRMLFGSRNMGLAASQAPLGNTPGTHWAYSSGTTNILSYVLRREIEASGQNYHYWVYENLFNPIGMRYPIFETDAGGTFIGSSYLYATAREWARLGQLYLDDGMWNGQRVLPEGTVTYATTASLPDDAPFYGAHWWLNKPLPDGQRRLPGLPDDAYFMGGHDVQRVIVIPSKNAVIVRLGMTRPPVDDAVDIMPGFAAIIDAL